METYEVINRIKRRKIQRAKRRIFIKKAIKAICLVLVITLLYGAAIKKAHKVTAYGYDTCNTLWDLADKHCPASMDKRDFIEEVKRLNNMNDYKVYSERLYQYPIYEQEMTGKFLGKINFAEFGTVRDYPFLIGLQLGFSMDGSSVMDGGKYTVNIDKKCRWNETERQEAVTVTMERLYEILNKAKVNYVSELVNMPVEVTLEDNLFKDFRILTEVL